MIPRSLVAIVLLSAPVLAQDKDKPAPRFKLPPGFIIEAVAVPPLVEHPMIGSFDDDGRLYFADSAGLNLPAAQLLKEFPNRVRVLEAADEKGVFSKGRIFAAKMSFPQGALWYRGSVFTASPPSIWKLTDTKGAGVADIRTPLVTKFGFTGNAADIHGPYLGPDGRIYWCDGRHGHDIPQPDGTVLKGKAARIFRARPDGTEVEVVCGGGMDNPVKIAFTDEGEPLVTVDILHARPARNDGIIFAIEGGVYPWHEVYNEFPRTGDLLPAVENLGWVAPAGLVRYRSDVFGPPYRGNLFSAQFNRHRIQRHVVERDGASFKIKTEDFLTSDDKNFHPTDVIEDADGSLLVIDTGGWFRIGCPTSKIAQPEIKGAVYRIRRTDAPKVDDPRGLKLAWAKATPRDLAARLADPRFAVRDRAIDELALRGDAALPVLESVLKKHASGEAVRNAVWTLCRMDGPAARSLVRRALTDSERGVRLAAIHAAGLHRDEKAAFILQTLVLDKDAAIRRQAATALGRLRKAEAIPPIMEALKQANDRFAEHALIYALIEINQAEELTAYLKQPDPRQQRAALIALDQMRSGKLERDQVTPLLATDDAALRQAALDVIARRPGWGKSIVALLQSWLSEKDLDPGRRDSVRDLVQGLSTDAAIQSLVTEALAARTAPAGARLVLLESMARVPLAKLPEGWLNGLRLAFTDPDPHVVGQAIAVVHQRSLTSFDDSLAKLARDPGRPPAIRIAAFAALDGRDTIDASLFRFLVDLLNEKTDALQRVKIARALGKSKLDAPQLTRLAERIAALGPLEAPLFLPAYAHGDDTAVGTALLDALEKSKALSALTTGELKKTFEGYPAPVFLRARRIMDDMDRRGADQKKRLDELAPLLAGGDVEQGRNIFFHPRALCATCHSVAGKGGAIGPDLSKIGAIRSGRDLLESLIFPSASFARGFEPWTVETKSGVTLTGLLARETADAIVLVTTDRQEIRLQRSDVESLQPGRVSIMPQGLDAQLSQPELRDLLAFLQSLR